MPVEPSRLFKQTFSWLRFKDVFAVLNGLCNQVLILCHVKGMRVGKYLFVDSDENVSCVYTNQLRLLS